jgi:hypothetical protein
MAATVLRPMFWAECIACKRLISRETRVALAVSRADQPDCRSWLCEDCEQGPVTTITEFSHYLAESGFGSVTLGWGDPQSPCG